MTAHLFSDGNKSLNLSLLVIYENMPERLKNNLQKLIESLRKQLDVTLNGNRREILKENCIVIIAEKLLEANELLAKILI